MKVILNNRWLEPTPKQYYRLVEKRALLQLEQDGWNGSAWTEVGDLNWGRYDTAGGGTYTSAIVTGGSDAGSPGGLLGTGQAGLKLEI